MKVYTYQRMGCAKGKVEMEDRILAGKNILADGFHYMEEAQDGIYAVFDGVGGLKGSAFASSLAAKSLAEVPLPANKEEISSALREVHDELVEYSSTATTATGLVWNEKSNVLLFHIGNTRVSILRDGYLVALTDDQTNYERMRQIGISESDLSDELKGVLMACLGARKELIESLTITEITQDISRSSRVVITSDGVHDHISVDDFEKIVKSDMNMFALETLAQKALNRGAEDDISIVVMEL